MFSTSSVACERLRRQAVPLRSSKAAKAWNEKPGRTDFVDWARVKVTGGCGGAGCISTLSDCGVEFAGPDGGDGGNGGHVVFKAVNVVKDLGHLKTVLDGPAGGKGKGRNCHGRDAKHMIIEVPVGTMFKNMVGKYEMHTLFKISSVVYNNVHILC